MKQPLLYAATVLLTCCASPDSDEVVGKYRWSSSTLRTMQNVGAEEIEQLGRFELTPTEVVAPGVHGDVRIAYEIRNGYIITKPSENDPLEMRLKILSSDSLLSVGELGLPGIYVRVKN
ncbi:hypothetical protein HNQ93_004027 [Hymenobacter luteus]|uniref:Uncharacterized protein n=2 Tax=Hymenobacter TaxID=89966 RepID=A0A7W9WCQ3_9BACT|nr:MULTISPECIES: hypothetical protein [Hymenobacter]MBB4603293.1 hypothetical protein [Hymenobacter latericoloratus]MBB6061149.1 hypothetical protein [Hymenobacter luteus]